MAKGNTAVYDALKTAALLAGDRPGGQPPRGHPAHRRQGYLEPQPPRRRPGDGAKQHDILVYTIGVGSDTDDQVLTALSDADGGPAISRRPTRRR